MVGWGSGLKTDVFGKADIPVASAVAEAMADRGDVAAAGDDRASAFAKATADRPGATSKYWRFR